MSEGTDVRSMQEKVDLHEDIRAILAATRQLRSENDEMMAALLMQRLDRHSHSPRTMTTLGARKRTRVGYIPALVMFAIGASLTVAIVLGLAAGASMIDFLGSWFFLFCGMALAVQVSAFIALRHKRTA